jgi:hypothetical protein
MVNAVIWSSCGGAVCGDVKNVAIKAVNLRGLNGAIGRSVAMCSGGYLFVCCSMTG